MEVLRVVPVDPAEDRKLTVFDGFPRPGHSGSPAEFGLAIAVHGLSQCRAIRVADGSDPNRFRWLSSRLNRRRDAVSGPPSAHARQPPEPWQPRCQGRRNDRRTRHCSHQQTPSNTRRKRRSAGRPALVGLSSRWSCGRNRCVRLIRHRSAGSIGRCRADAAGSVAARDQPRSPRGTRAPRRVPALPASAGGVSRLARARRARFLPP